MRKHEDRGDAGLERLGAELQAARPQLSALELDAVKRRVHARAGRATAEGTVTVKTRIAIIATLVFGMLFSTAGAGLAVTGFTDGDQASVAQYDGDDGGDVLGGVDTPDQGTAAPDVDAVEQSQFTAQGGGGLAFTGFAAIPVLLLGLGLLCAGMLLRRRTAPDR